MILVCGEALIDLFVGAAEGAEMPARAVAGGSPFNVAIGLARLCVKAALLAGISRDRFGALLAGILVREGVDDRFLVRTDRLSTISMVATDDNGQPSYAFHGEGAADRSLTLADLPTKLPPEVQALTFGSYTMAVEPVGSAFPALAERECGRRVISVDPNLRPAVVGDMARWATAAERFYRTATIIKASDEDVRAAWGGHVSVAEAAVYWLNCGARLVVVREQKARRRSALPVMFRCPPILSWCAIRSAPEIPSTQLCWRSLRRPTSLIQMRLPRSICRRSATCSVTPWPPPASPSRATVPTCRPRRTSRRTSPRLAGSAKIP
jgi:sugar/nucleoside kinase (ribokinase family)